MTSYTFLQTTRGGQLLLATTLLGLALAGCSRPTPTGRPVGSDDTTPEQAPPLPARPQPLPAQRVLQLAFTSNVAGDVEPCG